MKTRDLVGRQFGMLRVVAFHSTDKLGKARWECICRCGRTSVVLGSSLCRRARPTVSCGCLSAEVVRSKAPHRMSRHLAYTVWRNMRARCEKASHPQYPHYGGRGIGVCPAWRSFLNFWADMGPSYHPGLYLDRIDVDAGYEPGNCRWVSARVSTETRRNAIRVEFQGETMNLSEAARRMGVCYSTLFLRVKKGITPPELFAPSRRPK